MLNAIQDRPWVVQQCLQAVASDSTAQTKLIMLGLAETDTWARAEEASEASAALQDHQRNVADQGVVPEVDTMAAEQQVEHPQPPSGSVSTLGAEQSAADDHPDSIEQRISAIKSSATCMWRANRLNLLRHMTRLQTHLDLHNG